MSVGNRIRERRKKLNLTLEEAASRAGMKGPNLSEIETGKRNVLTDTLERIAEALNCHPADFFEYSYDSDEELTAGLRELLADKKTLKLMSISDQEIAWMRSIRFRPHQVPSKQDYIDLLFIYRNIE